MNLVITVCDQAAGEVCPIWPGGPVKAHWGIGKSGKKSADEAEAMAAMNQVRHQLESRIRLFLALPLETLDAAALKRETDAIGRMA